MLLVPKKLNPKGRHDLSNKHKKYDSICIEFEAGLNKNDRTVTFAQILHSDGA